MLLNIFISVVFSYICMISFDEGPSKNIKKVINEGVSLNIPLVFYLDPFSKLFNKEIVLDIIENGYEVGMSLTEEVTEDTIIDIVEKFEKEFIKKSGYTPILLRLPAVGQINNKTVDIAESKGYIVDIPNLDSEDDQKSDIWPFLSNELHKEMRKEVSIVFRDRYEKSVSILQYVVDLMKYKGYKIVPAKIFTGKDTTLKKSKNISTTYEVLNKSTPYQIRVFTVKDGKIIKEIVVGYSDYNKLFIRDIIKMKGENENEVEEMYKEIVNVCKVVEEGEVVTCQRNSSVYYGEGIIIMSIILLMY